MADVVLTFKEFIEEIGRDEAIQALVDMGYDEARASMIIAITLGEVDGDSKLTDSRR